MSTWASTGGREDDGMLAPPVPGRTALHPIAPNRRLLLTGLALVLPVLLVGLLAGLAAGRWWLGLLAGALAGGGLVAWHWTRAPRVLVTSLDTTPPDPHRDARLLNLAESLSIAVGVPVPELLVTTDPTVNAAVSGRSPRDARVVLTRGLLERLERVELEGALAWCFARVRDPGLAADTFTVTVIGPWRDRLGASSPLVRPVASLEPGPDLAAATDRAAVAITRYPPGLLGALERAGQAGTAVAGAGAATAPLWLFDPAESAGAEASTPSALALRSEVLREL